MLPGIAPVGTVTVMAPALQALTGAATGSLPGPLKVTVGVAVPVPNWPESTTSVPARPCAGLKPVTTSPPAPVPDSERVKPPPVTEPRAVVTVMPPDVAPEGTTTTRYVGVASSTCAGAPLNDTLLPEGTGLKPEPWICTSAFTPAEFGVKVEMLGLIEGTDATGSWLPPR
ncbi:hypothetical protein D3C87_1371700 [compost metagenome]